MAAWFLNYYQCPCGNTWSDEWSCTCDDECSECGLSISPDESDDLSDDEPEED